MQTFSRRNSKFPLDPCDFSFNSKSTTRGRGWSSLPVNDERMSVLHQDSGGIGKSIPSALEISLSRGFCTPRPSGFPSGFALWKSLGSRGAKPTALGNLSRFPSTLEISLGLRPREISRVSGNLSGVGDGFPNTSLVLVEHGYILSSLTGRH